MRALGRRLYRFEHRTFPPVDEEGMRVVAEIRERRRGRYEAEGRPWEEDDRPLEPLPFCDGSTASFANVIRLVRARRLAGRVEAKTSGRI